MGAWLVVDGVDVVLAHYAMLLLKGDKLEDD
jgi:hypothetical protein